MLTMHPGEYLNEFYIKPFELTQREMAACLGVSTAALSRLIAEKADLTAEMAVRLELALDRSAESWMAMQESHSLVRARKAVDPASVLPFDFKAAEALRKARKRAARAKPPGTARAGGDRRSAVE